MDAVGPDVTVPDAIRPVVPAPEGHYGQQPLPHQTYVASCRASYPAGYPPGAASHRQQDLAAQEPEHGSGERSGHRGLTVSDMAPEPDQEGTPNVVAIPWTGRVGEIVGTLASSPSTPLISSPYPRSGAGRLYPVPRSTTAH